MAKYTEARKNNNRKWDAANMDRLSFTVPKGNKEAIQKAAAAMGVSVNQYVQSAILNSMGLKEWPEK